jgi:hypothetical protein
MGQEYQALQAADLRATAEDRGFAVEVVDAGDNAVLQIQQLFRFIHAPEDERPLAFVVQTRVPDGLERVARNAAAAGIGWVLLNRTAPYVEALRQEHPRLAVSAVTTDHLEIGRIQGRQFRALLPRGGSVLYVQGPPETAAAQERLRAMQEGIGGAGLEGQGGPCGVDGGERREGGRGVAAPEDLRAVQARPGGLPERRPGPGGPQSPPGLPARVGARPLHRMRRLARGWAAAREREAARGHDRGRLLRGAAAGLLERAVRTGEPPPPVLVIPPHSFPPVEELVPRL